MAKLEQPPRPFLKAFATWHHSTGIDELITFTPDPARDAANLAFPPLPGLLDGWISPHGVSVAAMQAGTIWDFVYDDDLAPQQEDQGWRCTLCLDTPPRFYPSLATLWRAHLFEPLARWARTTLTGSPQLEFEGDLHSVTSAKILPSSPCPLFRECDQVCLLVDRLPFPAGAVGTIVMDYDGGAHFQLEMHTGDLICVRTTEIRKI
ncbi:hypothetical protein [Novosphingobium decolorationis]|uniref:Uncharacterized protein n=1 Tax=Novosphingobium decolorationis TaxID=2698673 RepID=A0ABX8EAE0_9SPHN|nr:hypothetical protein [Novosphingobium decolorationis]QVM85175.1 hypothetical protein HT578_17060 [Novosphingobium decolorationis]